MMMMISSIWPIDSILSGATTPGLSGPGNDGNEGVLCIPRSSSIHWNLTIRLFSVNQDTRFFFFGGVGSYPYVEKQSVYSTAPAD